MEDTENTKYNASYYRTLWLMAHNQLHSAAYDGVDPKVAFDAYIAVTATAEQAAATPI